MEGILPLGRISLPKNHTKSEIPTMSLVELFCEVDDFCQAFTKWEQSQKLGTLPSKGPQGRLALSEIITIVIFFHQTRHRDFKTYYNGFVRAYLRHEFPNLVSYHRFVELMPRTILPLYLYLKSRYGTVTGIAFIDATELAVCHNKRVDRHQVFAATAQRGKTTMGWFYGFKLHLVVNELGELLACCLTPGNVDDRVPVPQLTKTLVGKLFDDRGYLSQKLFRQLLQQDIQLITSVRRNMKNKLMPLLDKCLLRKRFIIETINDQLKNISQIEHTRHRSFDNFVVNLLAGLVAYTHQAKKPSLNLTNQELRLLPTVC